MEDIEYLEEYEDLVLPALNSAAAEAAAASFETNTNQLSQKNNEADDSSSSLDQDIFNCLFDDNSDDEDYNNYQNNGSESVLRQNTTSHEAFVTLEDKFQKIGNTVIEKVEISRQDLPKKQNSTPKPGNKITSTTKPKSFMTKTSGTTVSLSSLKQEISTNKTKSVATVRPTVNSQLNTNLPKKTNLLERLAPSTSSTSSASSSTKLKNSSASTALKSYRTIRFPIAPPKLSLSSASTPLPSQHLINKNPAVSSVTAAKSSTVHKKDVKRPATIVRPEKIISKDPANDPLDLDDISEANSNNCSFSDISGETYNTISDLGDADTNDDYYSGEDDFYADEDEANDISSTSQIIELSNDSNGEVPKLDTVRKQFKEPAQTKTGHLTPKITKTENVVSNVLNVSSKRILRPPALEIDIQNPCKKPKLDQTKKSTRFHNLAEDDLKEGLTITPIKTSVINKEQAIEKRKLNESVTIVRKASQNEVTEEGKNIPKETTILEKKVEEKVKERNVSQTSVNMLPEVRSDNESKQQLSNKDDSSKKRADVGNEADLPPLQSKISRSKLKISPNKSAGLGANAGSKSVLSFSDWLKTKSQNSSSESVMPKEDNLETPKRQSRARSRINPKSKEGKKSPEVSEEPPAKETASQDNISARVEFKASMANENLNVTQQQGSSLLQSSENQFLVDSKDQKHFSRSNKKVNVKRLQTSTGDPKKPSPSRSKKNEIALLIESMSKEMKDGGITDLLSTEKHVKRQRIPNTKNLGISALSAATPAKEPRTLATAVVESPNLQHSIKNPSSVEVSENLEYKNKSPSRRRVQQNLAKRGTSTPVLQTDTTSIESINTQDITALRDQVVVPQKPKIRKSLNIKDLPQHNETATKTSTALDVKKGKSAPIMSSELSSLAKSTNLSSRKVLSNSKQQKQPQASEVKVFKLFKPTDPSIVLNKADDKKLTDRRTKVQQTDEYLLKKFKCRKLAVCIDRTVVHDFLNSANNRSKSTITREKRTARPAEASKIVQNNSKTNLRTQTAADGAALFNVPPSSSSEMTGAQAAPTQLISSATNLQNSGATPISVSSQLSYILPSSGSSVSSQAVPLLPESFELKNEFVDETPTDMINEAILPDTPTLLARAQTITEAAQQALSHSATPTDIRLLAADSTENHFVPSFGMTPTALDNRGTCMYTFLHPAKYNRNHSNVLLDYCCPNLDGPMPAIDPTRIHAQVQVPVIELPASIVLTTKVVTRADLESQDTSIPAIIRKKAEKIRKNMATHHKMAVSTANTLSSTTAPAPISRATLPPTINALTKQLPPTTTITPKIRPHLLQPTQMIANQSPVLPPPSVAPTLSKNSLVSVIPTANTVQLNAGEQSSLRSHLRRFDVLLKQLAQPYESLSFAERNRIIEAVMSSGKCLPKDLEQTLVVMEEYLNQTMLLRRETEAPTPAVLSKNNYTTPQPAVVNLLPVNQMPQLQPSPKILAAKATPIAARASSYSNQYEQPLNKFIRRVQVGGRTTISATSGSVTNKEHRVPIYDADRNIIGYQMQLIKPTSTIPAYTKSTMSSHNSAIMSTSPGTSYKTTKRTLKRPAQDSPRVFYTTPPLKASTPKTITNSNIYPDQHAKMATTRTQKSQGSVVTTVRSTGSSSSADSATITTTTMATIKRVTRSTATGSKIIIVSKSNQSSEETILPDTDTNHEPTQQTEIKHEKDIEEFLG